MKKKTGCIAAACALILFFVTACLIAKVDTNSVYVARNIAGPIFYGAMLLLSVAVLVSYILFTKRRYIWVLLALVSVCIVNTGYLALSMASNVSEALLANRISYFGNVYMLLFLIITLSNACGITLSRAMIGLLFSVSTVMFLMAATQGYLDLFYRNVDFAIIDGHARILKDYGPMHTVYFVYILAYLGILVGTVIYSVRKKKVFSVRHCMMIGWIALVNVAIWIAEQFLPNTIEYLALSYVLNEVLLLWIYGQLVKEGALDSYIVTMKIRTDEEAEKTVDIIMENRNSDEMLSQGETVELEKLSPEELRDLIGRLPSESRLTERETEVAMLLLKNLKRKEMAASLCVSEDTIKTHTSHIYGKLNVKSRSALREMAGEIAESADPSFHPNITP